jgi:ParB-like chromosome segregation protein Spo0J
MKNTKQISGIPVFCRYDKAVEIEKITPHPRNPNKHPDEQLALLAKIIRAQGWRNPIVVSNRSGYVVKGHARLKAAGILNVAQAPVEHQDYATDAEEYADMIADNRIAELAERDMAMIKDLLSELDTGAIDMDLTGYKKDAIESLMLQSAPEEKIETLNPFRRLHVLFSVNAGSGLEILPELEQLAEKYKAEIHHAGN